MGILGLLLEHPIREALAKPLAAAIFLIVNGFILLAAERFRRRADVLALARREGLNAEGARSLDTLEYREAAVIGTFQSTALIAGISRDGVCMTGGLARGLDNADAAHFAFLLATPPILAAGLLKVSDLTGPLGGGHPGRCGARRRLRRHHGDHHRPLPDQVLQGPQPDPVRDLLHRASASFMVLFTLIVGAPT